MSIKPSERISRISEYYFSSRLDQIRQMEKSGIYVINLGIGSPDTPPAREVIEEAVKSITLDDSHSYQPYRGITELRESFGRWYKERYNVLYNPESEIVPLLGSKEGVMHISMAFLNRGDGVLVPDPGYPAYAAAARLCSARCIYYDLTAENGWMPDLDYIEKSGIEGVKLMWVNYPNMPTGKKASQELFDRLVAFGRRNNILIVNDNPYGQILNDNPLSIMSTEGAKETAMELNSLSKSHSMAGWRIGMLGGKKEYIDYVLRVKSNMDSGMFLPLQRAAIAAMNLTGCTAKGENRFISCLIGWDAVMRMDREGCLSGPGCRMVTNVLWSIPITCLTVFLFLLLPGLYLEQTAVAMSGYHCATPWRGATRRQPGLKPCRKDRQLKI
jgi:aspartate/methionine/tyrosine aminotransferase